MKETLARLAQAWQSLPQSTKLLLAGLLLVLAISLWYVGFYLPAQAPVAAETPQAPAEETPKALEAPPIPPLAESAPSQPSPPTPSPAPTAPQASIKAETTPLPLPQAKQEAPPPNPFVPLVVEVPATAAPPLPSPTPTPAIRPQPVPTGAPVRVSQGTPLPTPQVATAPRPLPGTSGALPAPKVLTPTPKAQVAQAPVEASVAPAPPTALVEAPLSQVSQEAPPTPGQAPEGPAKTPLEALVEEKGLKLSGTLLGPVSVAILESKEGYLVLPVGSPIPGTEAVVRRIEGERITLALKEETLELAVSQAQAGGGQ
ncbi:competence protein [Thermus brockianus]|uniref:Competence protein n=1 Tax=Thermus brockianus TaxID=56956 RepID=A0ABM7XM15_THEBO|nr:competence protein [Thermus brockianus]BDG17362.1 competence protein [Thermus brockianus]